MRACGVKPMRVVSPHGVLALDDNYFPLVDVHLEDGHVDEDWAWLLGQFEKLFSRQKRYALLFDATLVCRPPTPGARKMITDWQVQHMKSTARWNVGSACVISSGLIRGA